MARYLGCGICMKVCPVQKYGLKNVMDHYASTGQVLGKGTHDLEGYELEGKGYFGPGELPVFESDFFSSMPHGNVDEWAFALTHPQSDLTTTVSQVIVSPVYVAK